jgi:hypothetical protein
MHVLLPVLRQPLYHLIELLSKLSNVIIALGELHPGAQIVPRIRAIAAINSSSGRCTNTTNTSSTESSTKLAPANRELLGVSLIGESTTGCIHIGRMILDNGLAIAELIEQASLTPR